MALAGVAVFFCKGGAISPKMLELQEKTLRRLGGTTTHDPVKATHVVCDKRRTLPDQIQTLTNKRLCDERWITRCSLSNALVEPSEHVLTSTTNICLKPQQANPSSSSLIHVDQDLKNEDIDYEEDEQAQLPKLAAQQGKTPKQHLLDVFKIFVNAYDSDWKHSDKSGHGKRGYHYRQLYTLLENELDDWFVAADILSLNLHGLGEKSKDKIFTVYRTGSHPRADEFMRDPRLAALQNLTQVFDIGPKKADELYTKGIRSVEQLRDRPDLAALVGQSTCLYLKHMDDLHERVPREEIETWEKLLRDVARGVDDRIGIIACGSYRRGEIESKDVDLLLWVDGAPTGDVVARLLPCIKERGFEMFDLKTKNPVESGFYFGIGRLPGIGNKFRRVDFRCVPYTEFACSLFHWTGNEQFNRSISRCANEQNLSFSNHGIFRRDGSGAKVGPPKRVDCEEDIFRELGLQYVLPSERKGKLNVKTLDGQLYFARERKRVLSGSPEGRAKKIAQANGSPRKRLDEKS